MSAVRTGSRRKQGALTQQISSLEQRAAELAAQLQQLQLQNDSARRREAVLTEVNSVTRLAVDILQELGQALPGVAAPVSYNHGISIAKIDTCVNITLRDQPFDPEGAAPQPLCWPRSATAPLAPQLADGGPLALLQHFLALLQQHPHHFAFVTRETPATSRDMMFLMQGVLHALYNMGQPGGDASHLQCSSRQSTSTTFTDATTTRSSSNGCSSGSGSSGGGGSSSTPSQQGCAGGGSSMVVLFPALAAAAAAGISAAVATGGGRALGCTLAFLEVAGVVHDALLEQQQQQQEQQQDKSADSGIPQAAMQQQLVEEWAGALVAAAQHRCWAQMGVDNPSSARHAAAAGGGHAGGGDEEGGMSDVDCALLGAVLGLSGSLLVVLMSEPGRIMELALSCMRPIPPEQLKWVTQKMCLDRGQVQEVLWVAALYQDLRKPHFSEQNALEGQVGRMLATLTSLGQPPAAGAQPQPGAPAAPAAAAKATADSDVLCSKALPVSSTADTSTSTSCGCCGQSAKTHEGASSPQCSSGRDGAPDPQLVSDLCMQLHARSRLNFWWEVLQTTHVWGLMSVRQAATFLICMAPAGPSPNCWSTRLLLALLEGQQSQLAARTAGAAVKPGRPANDLWQQLLGGQTKGRRQTKSACSEAAEVKPWVPLPVVAVPSCLLQAAGGRSRHATTTAAGHGAGPLGSNTALPPPAEAPMPTRPAAAAAGAGAAAAADDSSAQGAWLSAAPSCGPSPPGLPGNHPGGWMGWLGSPDGPLGCDAPQLMPLVVAAQMSAAAATAAQAASPASAPAAAAVGGAPVAAAAAAAGAADLPPGQLPLLALPDLGARDAPHSPVPPDLFDRAECVSPRPGAPPLAPSSPCLAHNGGGAGDGPGPLAGFDPMPEGQLPDNALHRFEQLMDCEDPTLHLLASLLA